MSDTTSRVLRQAWRLTADSPSSNEIPVSKLYELLINLEAISKKKILDAESIAIVKGFIDDNKHKGMMITLDTFKPFFNDLIGTSLQSIVGTPPPKLNLNLNSNPTANFINRELINLKKQNMNNEEEIKYRDQLLNDLESSNSRLSQDYNQQRSTSRKYANDLNISNQYIDQLHSYNNNSSKSNNNSELQLLQKLNEQVEIQNKLVNELKMLKRDMSKPQSFTVKSINGETKTTSLPSTQKTLPTGDKFISWKKIMIYTLVALMILSLLNFSFEYFQDSIMDNLFEDIEL